MLPKEYRLPSFLIPRVLKSGRRFFSSNFNLVIKKNEETKVAILVGKAVKKATARNRVKRLTREAIRLVLPAIKKGFLILIFPKEEMTKKKMPEVRKEIEIVFKKIGVL